MKALEALCEVALKSQYIFLYLINLPSPTILNASYIDWIPEYIDTYI